MGNELLCAICMHVWMNVCAELQSVFHIYPGILKTSLSFIYASTAEQNYTKMDRNSVQSQPIVTCLDGISPQLSRDVWDNVSFYHRRIALIRIDRMGSGLWY